MSDEPSKSPSFWSYFTQAETPRDPRPAGPGWFTNPAPPGTPGSESQTPCALVFDRERIFWAMQNLPAVQATKHFLICGTTGSGKSTAIELFLRSIVPRIRSESGPPEQLILYDPKCDVVPLLAALGLPPEDPRVWLLNPIDDRSAVWNVAEATSDPLLARHFATLLVPEEKHSSSPYFADAARELVYAVLLALQFVDGANWKLRDLLCSLESLERLRAVTDRHARAKALTARVLSDHQHGGGVFSTLGTKLGKLEQVAALWHTKSEPKELSIEQFLLHSGVLILGDDPVLHDSFWPINAILLKALTQQILRRPNTLEPRHWFVLDEFRAMEKVDAIHDLLNRGRSKGASVLLGLQSIDGLLEVYGEHAANDILSQCAHKTFLRAGGPVTAQWAERFFGKVRRTEPTLTESGRGLVKQKSVAYHVQERSLFTAAYFLDLPYPRPGANYSAVSDVPSLPHILITRRPFDQLLKWCHKSEEIEKEFPGVALREDEENKHLQPWTWDEEEFFCGRPVHLKKPVDATQSEPAAKSEPASQPTKPAAAAATPEPASEVKKPAPAAAPATSGGPIIPDENYPGKPPIGRKGRGGAAGRG